MPAMAGTRYSTAKMAAKRVGAGYTAALGRAAVSDAPKSSLGVAAARHQQRNAPTQQESPARRERGYPLVVRLFLHTRNGGAFWRYPGEDLPRGAGLGRLRGG